MRITERQNVSLGRVDHEKGIVHDVQLLGERSSNGYGYTEKARRKAVQLYEGAEINWDHVDDDPAHRPSADPVGFVQSPRFDESTGVARGDIQVYKSHPLGPLFLERAEKNPKGFGMSHAINGGFNESGTDVDEISEVLSIDIVRRPATNKNLFESERPEAMNVKLSTLLEGLKEGSAERESIKAAVALDASLADQVLSIEESAAPAAKINKALSASLAAMVKLAAQPGEQVQEEESNPPADQQPSDKLTQLIESLSKDVAALKESAGKHEKADLARSVLMQEAIEPDADMIEELVVCENAEAMRSTIYGWPVARRNGFAKPPVRSGQQIDESQNDYEELPASLAMLCSSDDE